VHVLFGFPQIHFIFLAFFLTGVSDFFQIHQKTGCCFFPPNEGRALKAASFGLGKWGKMGEFL